MTKRVNGKEVRPKYEGYEVEQVRSIPGYLGMNSAAAKELKQPWHHDRDTVIVQDQLSPVNKKIDAQHEIDENRLMREKGLHYKQAHARATKLENLGLHRRIGSSDLGEKIRFKKSKAL